MEPGLRVTLRWEEPVAKESLFTCMGRCMKGIGDMIKLKAMGLTCTPMGPYMKENGCLIYSMERAQKSGQMALPFRENIEMGRRMGEADMSG